MVRLTFPWGSSAKKKCKREAEEGKTKERREMRQRMESGWSREKREKMS